MDFSATRVSTEDFAGNQIKSIIFDANKQIENERRLIAQGFRIFFDFLLNIEPNCMQNKS